MVVNGCNGDDVAVVMVVNGCNGVEMDVVVDDGCSCNDDDNGNRCDGSCNGNHKVTWKGFNWNGCNDDGGGCNDEHIKDGLL